MFAPQVFSEAPPISGEEIEEIADALTRANSQEAAFRKLCIEQFFFAVGRGGEVAATTFDNLQLSKALKLFKLNWYKLKGNKQTHRARARLTRRPRSSGV